MARKAWLALSTALALLGCAEPAALRGPAPVAPRSGEGGAALPPASEPAAPPPAGAAQAPGAPPPSGRHAALRFDLGDRPFPSPLLDAVVSGQPTTVLIDTGASHHIIARWLVDELALPLSRAGDVGVDHAGRPVQVSRLERATLALSGWGTVQAPALLVVPVPDALRRIGLGGFISPQTLPAPGRAVLLDLRAGVMLEAPREEAARALRAELGSPAVVELRACAGPNQGHELTATARVEGLSVTLKIDSGASQSSLFAASPAGKRLAPRAAGKRSAYAASGKHTVPVLEDARIQLAALDAAADIDLLPGAPRATCPADGFAGMDVLRSCVLLLAQDGGLAACAPP